MKVSLQINLAPSDYPHARYILKHQLAILANQVDEILLIVDTNPSKGRFASGWHENKKNLYDFLSNEIEPNYNVKIVPVDYSPKIKENIGAFFFDSKTIPAKDFRGGPFYAYFFGLFYAKNDLIFHIDSDIFLGGASKKWVEEAVYLLDNNPNILTVSPLPGPPHPEEKLIGQSSYKRINNYAFEFKGMSTRIFMLNKSIFKKHKLILSKPAIRSQIKAIVEGNSNADLPEHLFDNYMSKHQLVRVDFLGAGSGLWSIHPPFRNQSFYQNLPKLITDIDQNNLPVSQYGYYDMVDEMCDWSENKNFLKTNRWWKRLLNG